jgi:hypothetical protein
MSNRGLATGVFRAWGVMWSIYALVAVPQFLNALFRNPYTLDQKATQQYFFSSQAISLGCEIAIAVFLIRQASWLATVVFPQETEMTIAIDAAQLRSVLFAVVGLYFLIDGARYALGTGYQLITRPRGDSQAAAAYLWQHAPESFVRAVGGLLAGAIVLFGRGRNPWQSVRGIYRKLFSLRDSPNE